MNPNDLLTALPGPTPCGQDLSFSLEFDELQALRRDDDASIPRGELDAEPRRADWPAVQSLAGTLLRERSKDLRLAAWWTEAAARLQGHAGLADGLALCAGLCEAFWDDLHPQPTLGDAELRAGSIAWLLALVAGGMRHLPVLHEGGRGHSLADIGNLREQMRSSEDDTSRAAREAWAGLHRAASCGGLQGAMDALPRVADTLQRLQAVVDARLGEDGPAFVGAREAVHDAMVSMDRLASEMGILRDGRAAPSSPPQPLRGAADAAPGQTMAVLSTRLGGPPGQPVMPGSRAQALAQLRMVADYFRLHEPHSPVAYLAERAAQWGEMPLHVWLRTVIKEPGALAGLEELLGVPTPDLP